MWKPPEHQLPVSTSKGGFESGAGVKWRSGKVAPKGVKAFPLRSPFHFNLGAGSPGSPETKPVGGSRCPGNLHHRAPSRAVQPYPTPRVALSTRGSAYSATELPAVHLSASTERPGADSEPPSWSPTRTAGSVERQRPKSTIGRPVRGAAAMTGTTYKLDANLAIRGRPPRRTADGAMPLLTYAPGACDGGWPPKLNVVPTPKHAAVSHVRPRN